jgi:bifunctional polynucleotide phosphatase/kinase
MSLMLICFVEQAVASFFKPTSEKKKEPEKISWRTIDDSLLIGRHQTSGTEVYMTKKPGKRKIAAFDFVCYNIPLTVLV